MYIHNIYLMNNIYTHSLYVPINLLCFNIHITYNIIICGRYVYVLNIHI